MSSVIRIGSRPSALALAQAAIVGNGLKSFLGGARIEVVPIRTTGDKLRGASLTRLGGKGLFIKELEQALGERRIDVAVHSMKDLPATLLPGFRIVAVPPREDPRDALVTRGGEALFGLRRGARVGTSSLRRRFEMLRLRHDLEAVALRGNVDTRLARLFEGQLDAVILAMAGLLRLNRREDVNLCQLDERDFVPAAGQGALAIEALAGGPVAGSQEIEQALTALGDERAAAETQAERSFLATIGASCFSPVGVNGKLEGTTLELRALLFSPDGARELSDELEETIASPGESLSVGAHLGERMLKRGAAELLAHGS